MKFDDEAMWAGITRHHWRITTVTKWLLAVVAVIALIITAVSAWRYVADCTVHFGTLDCARAWLEHVRI
jgi:hypothetical protein